MPLAVDRMEALEERRKKAAARKPAPLIPAPLPAPRPAPVLTEEAVKANLGVPLTGGLDVDYLAGLGVKKTSPTVPAVTSPQVTAPALPTSIQPKKPSSSLTKLLSQYQNAIRAAPVSEEDIMDLPSYQAMQKLNEQTLGERLAALKRQFGAWGTLRGTPSIQAMANAVGQATTQLGGLIPEMLQTTWQREQQNLQNLAGLIGLTRDVEDTGFSQGLQEFGALAPYRYETVAGQRQAEQFAQQLPFKEAEITGIYKGQPTQAARQAAATQALSRARLEQEADYRSYLKQKDLTEQQGEMATNGYISQILAQPTADAAFNYIVEHANDIVNDGADINKILAAFRQKWPERYSASLAGLGE